MSKQLLMTILVGIVVLIIGGLFIFGVFPNHSRTQVSDTSQTDSPTPPSAATPEKIPDNLKIEDITVGTGKVAKAGDTVVMNYVGMLPDGTKFDSSYDRGQPFTTQIGVGQVIKGWDLGVPGMKVGGKRRLTIPPELGYGAQGAGDKIPPNSTLIFEVELMGVQ